MADKEIINIGKSYSRYPVGRYRNQGRSNGEGFREDLLRPALMRSKTVAIEFDDALGYGSSFLDEVFGGLVRGGFSKQELISKLILITADDSLRDEVLKYINEAKKNGR